MATLKIYVAGYLKAKLSVNFYGRDGRGPPRLAFAHRREAGSQGSSDIYKNRQYNAEMAEVVKARV